MIKVFVFLFSIYQVHGYFTLPGKCPENVKLQDDFRLAEFFGTWYQAYHYSSDGQSLNNCAILSLVTTPTGIYFNQSRVDRGLFMRFSVGKVEIPTDIEKAAELDFTFTFENAPRRLKTRRYNFHVLATNNNYYATTYTCQYSPLIDKHFIYVWIWSRTPSLNVVSKELAMKPLQQIGVDSSKLVEEDRTKCNPKYFEMESFEPTSFRYPVPI